MRILPTVVPDETKFMDLIQQVRAVRGNNRPECSLRVEMEGDIDGDSFELLEASYDAPISVDQDSVASEPNTGLLRIKKDRIRFWLDEAVHTKVKEMLVVSEEEWTDLEEDVAEEEDI
jgi:hypothetical protein